MKDEATDIILLVVLLAVTITIAFNSIVPMYREAVELSDDVLYDKTVQILNGAYYGDDMDFEEGMSYYEMVMELGTQSYFMPTPRVLNICGESFAIQSKAQSAGNTSTDKYASVGQVIEETTDAYTPETEDTFEDVRTALYTWCANFKDLQSGKMGIANALKLRYSLRFTVGDTEELTDDAYAVYILAEDKWGKTVYFRCTSGGKYIVPSDVTEYTLIYSK